MKRPGRGFTLVELLVVIGIIGLLIALLFPGLRAAFDAAAEAACQNNIGQLAKAVASYCTQYGGSFPIGVVGSLGGSNNYSASNWLYCFNGGKRDFDQGLLARLNYIGRTDIFYCPEDADAGYKRPASALLLPSGTAPTSYAINASITYGDVPYQIGPGFPAVVRSRRFDMFDARDFMFIEESDAGNNEARPSDFDCGHMTPVGNYHLTSRHRGGGYISCMDGHVEWYNADDFEAGMNRLSGADWYKQTFPRPTGAPAGKESPEEVASHWNPG